MSDAAPSLDFKGKLGKFPVWVWGVIVAVGALVVYFLFIRSRGGTASTTSAALDPSGYQTAGIKGGTASATLPVTAADNNVSWLTRVARQVSDSLAKSPSDTYAAIKKWLNGEAITRAEKAIVDEAIKLGMNPPDGTLGTSTILTSFLKNTFNIFERKTWQVMDDGTKTVYKDRQAVWADGRPVEITDATGAVVNAFIKRGANYFVRNVNGVETQLNQYQADGINAQFGPNGAGWING